MSIIPIATTVRRPGLAWLGWCVWQGLPFSPIDVVIQFGRGLQCPFREKQNLVSKQAMKCKWWFMSLINPLGHYPIELCTYIYALPFPSIHPHHHNQWIRQEGGRVIAGFEDVPTPNIKGILSECVHNLMSPCCFVIIIITPALLQHVDCCGVPLPHRMLLFVVVVYGLKWDGNLGIQQTQESKGGSC